jgi:hypothetical protein
MEQIERIRHMEQLFDLASESITELSMTHDKYEKMQYAIAALSNYYSNDEWKQDFADDEAGLLPENLKRGVLSEDGIWNLLSDWRELEERLRSLRENQL